MNRPTGAADAVAAWTALLGDGYVLTDAVTLDRYSRTTQREGTRPAVVLYPTSTEQIQEIVRIASAENVVLYPISRGRNFGYGDACAPTDHAAIVDLSKMNRIIEVDPELAYAVIEPGVTQHQLHEYLSEHHPNLWFDCSGAGLDASIVGNTVDRGFGHTRYGDHTATSCGFEVVLADGRVLRTGFGHYANAKAAHVYPYGVGPQLDGLFAQSNFGIVTKMTLWLMPKPEAFTAFFLVVENAKHLAPTIDGLRKLRLDGTVTWTVHTANDLRLIAAQGNYPWEEANNVTPLPEEIRARLRKENGYGMWNVAGALSGSREVVRAAKKEVQLVLEPIANPIFLDENRLQLAETFIPTLNRFGLFTVTGERLKGIWPNFRLMQGVPTDAPRRGTHWRLWTRPENETADPLEARAGLYWLSPVLPARGRDAEELVSIVEPLFAEHGFEPLITLTFVTERSLVAIVNVSFDKNDPKQAAAAETCYKETMQRLMDRGYPPYRTGLQGMSGLHDPDDVFWQVAAQLKRTLDPNDILARGRYIPPLTPEG